MVSSTTPRFGPRWPPTEFGLLLREDVDEFLPHLLGKSRELLLGKGFDVGGGLDGV